MPRIVGITGLAGSGKSSVASFLTSNHDFVIVKFADILKSMLRQLGLSEEELEGDRKGLPSKLLLGRSPRYAMQTLGTEWGRQLLHENIWCEVWKRRARQLLATGIPVVCDDCRFENEAHAIEDLGGELWSVSRPGVRAQGHISESGAAMRFATVRITNGGSLRELELTVADLINRN